jgi:hypothetical protein
MEFGHVAPGRRRVIPILGGTFEGPAVRGIVVPGGADWQIFIGVGERRPDEVIVHVWKVE